MVNIKEAQTRKDLIDPKLAEAGWDTTNQDIKVICEYPIAPGKIESQGRKRNPKSADYVLEYKGRKLAVIEAKSEDLSVLDAIAEDNNRMLLTLATGTGKTVIAFEIAWKLFYSHWNLMKDGKRQPRILFLTDRNVLANQAFNAFSPFPEDALVRIKPSEIKKKGRVPKNGSIFFTIFQTFMSGKDNTPYFGQYPKDYFDLIIIDECHRGGANDEGNWRTIMEYFSPAFQLGLTATPKRKENADTYRYFGKPLYEYSLKECINDGFLTPFKIRIFKTTLDEYIYTPDDNVIEGEVEAGKIYQETD